MYKQKNPKLRLSVVVPVYNEESYLKECLEAIEKQTVKPYEVIIVDNNSTDKSAAIASSFSSVRIIQEPQQGVTYANAAGFNAARGDIIARFDADTRLTPTWCENIIRLFQQDDNLTGVTGRAIAYDYRLGRILGYVQVFFYQYVQKLISGTFTLWGSNMALRRAAWREVSRNIHYDSHVDDDIDITLLLKKGRHKVSYRHDLVVYASLRRGQLGLITTAKYLSTWPKDYFVNKYYLQSIFIAFLAVCSLIIVTPYILLSSTFKTSNKM